MRATVTIGKTLAELEGTPDELAALLDELDGRVRNTKIAVKVIDRAATVREVTKAISAPTPARALAMRKQGEYMGTLRKLSAKDQARVKKVTKAEGRDRGLAYARRLVRADA